MSQSVSKHHPAVVLRSQHSNLRVLLAIALVAVIALSVTAVVLISDDDGGTTPAGASTSAPVASELRYDGGPDEGTRGVRSPNAPSVTPSTARPDGGPEEGTVGPGAYSETRSGTGRNFGPRTH